MRDFEMNRLRGGAKNDYLALLDAGEADTANDDKEHEVGEERLRLDGGHCKRHNSSKHLESGLVIKTCVGDFTKTNILQKETICIQKFTIPARTP
jgi:hypothetical protein